tara:strand:+ start:252 stop:533 length:282 start_codon:yes stop_codon:yes gene_type:complete
MENPTVTNKPKRGRPSYEVAWPASNFTVNDVYQTLDGKLSAVSVQLKVNKAVEKGQLERVGVKRKVMGRPTIVYRTTATRDKTGNPDPHFNEK